MFDSSVLMKPWQSQCLSLSVAELASFDLMMEVRHGPLYQPINQEARGILAVF
jgi:hypothetical protein